MSHSSSQKPKSLETHLRRLLANASPRAPLPTTRELGQRFEVANTTVFRVLRRLVVAGEIWQHPNGRFYPATAKAVLERPKPVACVTRRLEVCSELYRELLEGISAGCGAARRSILMWHDELLLNHPDPTHPPVFAEMDQQRAILGEFLERHGESAGGFVLDHVWTDEALKEQSTRLVPAVVLYRRCRIDGFHNVYADFEAGALQALGHLLGRGYDQIVPVEPFQGDPAVAEFLDTLETSAAKLGCSERLAARVNGATAKARVALFTRLRAAKQRVALLCPEDNVSVLLLKGLRDANLRSPERVGLLSVMGTDFAAHHGLSHLRFDFRTLGRLAVDALRHTSALHSAIEPQLVQGVTT